jgi:hypothetical protein
MMVPAAHETELVAAIVRAQIANAKASAKPAAAAPAACVAPSPPHTWNSTQRDNATTIVEVGLAMGVSERGLVVALATAMQESQLYNLGNLGANNDHDSLGLFQQRPSMGWGSAARSPTCVFRHGFLSGSAPGFRMGVDGGHGRRATRPALQVP